MAGPRDMVNPFKDVKPVKTKTFSLPQHYPSLSSSSRRLVRQQYEQLQKGRCHYCSSALNQIPAANPDAIDWRAFPGGQAGFLRYPIHLHHDHKTGMTIGAVHALCNAILWQVHGE